MARAPVAGKCKTRLIPTLGAAGAATLYAAMLQDTLAAWSRVPFARKVLFAAPEDMGVAVLRTFAPAGWSVAPQVGDDLGTRMGRALRSLLRDSSAAVIVGSDAPTVPVDAASAALPRLSGDRRALLGPADDGGYWLIGVTTFEPLVFQDIPWSTPEVLRLTREALVRTAFSVEDLPVAYDVDDVAHLDRLRAELGADPSRAPQTAAALHRAVISSR